MTKGASHEEVIACAGAVDVAAPDGTPLTRIRMLPAGSFTLKDGRGPYSVEPASVLAAIRRYWGSERMPLDYDHQTLATQTKGGQGGVAPASAWVSLDKITAEADGLWANDIEWTPAAAAKITGKEYRYFSPLMGILKSGVVANLYGGGLTNDPAIGGLTTIAASSFHPQEEPTMSLSVRLAAILGLAATATEDEVFVAASTQAGHLASLRSALGAKADDTSEAVVAAAAALKSKPAVEEGMMVVPAAAWETSLKRLSALEGDKVAASVARGVEDGKITPATEPHMKTWAERDLTGFEAWLKDAPVVIAASANLGKPAGDPALGLTAEELQAASALGMTPEEFAGKAVAK